MDVYSTAEAEENTEAQGAQNPEEAIWIRYVPWVLASLFAVHGVSLLLGDGLIVHITQTWLTVTSGLLCLIAAYGLWRREKTAVPLAVVLLAAGFVHVFVTVQFEWVVPSILLIGMTYAIPNRVWH